jgi:glycosyltransferase involved in cell wall biosynthesis
MHNNKRPVILQVLPALKPGGVERGTIEITKALAKAGAKALVASSGGPLTPSIGHAGGEHITLPVDSKNPFRILRNVSALEKIIRENGVDIIHARSRAPAWSAYYAAKRTGIRFVTTFHGIYGTDNEFKRRYNAIMTRGERVIAVSHFVAEHIKEQYAVNPGIIRVIHRGIDAKQFDPNRVHPQRMAELARAWAVPEHLPLILFPGRITRWKGQHIFIEALAKLPHRNFQAFLVGDDTGHEDYHRELEELIVAKGLEGHVRFVGPTQHMAEAYVVSRIVVAASTQPEAFGRVALEAQAMGRPVITTDHGGALETVLHGQTGWLVPPGDVAALSHQIESALQLDDETYNHMSAIAVQNALNFTSDAMCAQTLRVYEEVLGAQPRKKAA